MPSRDPEINAIAAAKAREAWIVPPCQASVRGRLRIPSDLVELWDSQDTDERGLAWAIGCILTNPAASYIVGNDGVTVVLGQHSATAPTQYEAVVSLVQSYGYELSQADDLVAVMAKPRIKVEQFNQEDEGFWALMGRYFASAKVKRDFGIAMNSDESYQWFLAFAKETLVGFCAVVPAKSGTDLKHLYVIEGEGIETQLLGCAIAAASKPLRATVREDEFALYEKQGFKVAGRRGQYLQIVRG